MHCLAPANGQNEDEETRSETGPIDVKILGNVAVAQGSDIEKSTTDGKDSNGKYVWTDVYAERGGKWQAVRSHVSKVK